jgi:hypothetical protein
MKKPEAWCNQMNSFFYILPFYKKVTNLGHSQPDCRLQWRSKILAARQDWHLQVDGAIKDGFTRWKCIVFKDLNQSFCLRRDVTFFAFCWDICKCKRFGYLQCSSRRACRNTPHNFFSAIGRFSQLLAPHWMPKKPRRCLDGLLNVF